MGYYNDLTLSDTHTTDDEWYDRAEGSGGLAGYRGGVLLSPLARVQAQFAQEDRERRAALLASCPLKAGDQVRRRDGAIGIVRYAFVQTGNSSRPDRVKVAVDWPALNRIGGDGWHRSTVLVSALTAV